MSCATDPGHILIMTRNFIRWVKVGLAVKYECLDAIPEDYSITMAQCLEIWKDAQIEHGSNTELWPVAIMKCFDAADDVAIIAGLEDLLDYAVIDYNFTQHMLLLNQMSNPELMQNNGEPEGLVPNAPR